LRRDARRGEDRRVRRRVLALAAGGAAALFATVALAAPGDISLVSVSSGGAQGATAAEASAVSADGRFVAFTSASALTATPTGGVVQLYVRDRAGNTTVMASTAAGGQAANAAVDAEDVGNVQFSISGNGRYVVFASAATNLTPADSDPGKDVFRKDLETGAVELVSVNSAGQKANAAVGGDPDVSFDGRRVAFTTGGATNLISPDANAGLADVVVRDLATGTTVLAAQNAAGVQANGTTERPAISADGLVVAFEAPTGTNNLLPGDASPGDVNDIVVRNLAAGTTAGASDPTAGVGSSFPDISGDGRHVVFETGFAYDPTNEVSAGNDTYRRDMATRAIVLASARDGVDTGGDGLGIRPAVSADGGRVAFTSGSTNLFGTDANTVVDIYARDVGARTTRRASVQANGTTESDNASQHGAVAGNGAIVSFVNNDAGATTKLVVADANNVPDVFAKEFAPTDATPPAIAIAGATGTATDPSGIGEVTVNGAAVAVGAGGTFPVPTGPGTHTARAVDGAGNAGTASRTVAAAVAPRTTSLRPRIARLRASLKGRVLTVRFRLAANARVTVTLLRRTVKKRPRRKVVLTRVGKPVARSLRAGRRTVVLRLKKRPAAGRYVVRVRARAAGLVVTKTTALRVQKTGAARR
jgi:Tol biopolymer transport system component